jgi:hypothetical protein
MRELVFVRVHLRMVVLVRLLLLQLLLQPRQLLLGILQLAVLLALRHRRLRRRGRRGFGFRGFRRGRFTRRRLLFLLLLDGLHVGLLDVALGHLGLLRLEVLHVALAALVDDGARNLARRRRRVHVQLGKELRARLVFVRRGDVRLDVLRGDARDGGVRVHASLALRRLVLDGVEERVARRARRRALRRGVVDARLVLGALLHRGRRLRRRRELGELRALGVERVHEGRPDGVRLGVLGVGARHWRGHASVRGGRGEAPVERLRQVPAPRAVRHHRQPHARHGDEQHRHLGFWVFDNARGVFERREGERRSARRRRTAGARSRTRPSSETRFFIFASDAIDGSDGNPALVRARTCVMMELLCSLRRRISAM